ncbi:cellulase family glycosylhydrolase [Jiulongibacter sp. NS-SX5]|uniref:cellulase family glycosylhydrolase n=1 Tax=Jiulongibacter sp. NS-SX5 TaxID=3463854 RepID=UPI00405A2E59
MRRSVFLVVLLALSLNVFAQQIFELNQKLGKGMNMGNMFEAPSETAWGNPFQDDYFQKIADLGFTHVRLPITWETDGRMSFAAPYTIEGSFMNRVKHVVDEAYKHNLMIVINMHHHNDLFEKPVEGKDRFLANWEQISAFFKDYDENLIFEILNEPHGNLSPELWNEFLSDALDVIRVENPDRAVLIGVAEYGGLAGLPKLLIPEDPNLILTIHYYEPFQFTHQGAEWVTNADPWLGTKWENTDLEQKAVISQFAYAINYAAEQNLPIHIGEFGAYSKADSKSRELWTAFLARWFEQQGFSWAYWEFSAGFGIYNPQNGTYNQGLVDALLTDELPEAVETTRKPIYTSDFSAGTHNWSLSVNGDATATFEASEDKAQIAISEASDQGWHVQFQQPNIALQKGKRYFVSFTAQADVDFSFSTYLGRSVSPWDSYSGFSTFTLTENEQQFEYTFLMTEADDPQARWAFDMGGSTGNIQLWNLKVEELTEAGEEQEEEEEEEQEEQEEEEETALGTSSGNTILKLYPNPADSSIKVYSKVPLKSIAVFDAGGKLLKYLDASQRTFLVNDLPSGLYHMVFNTSSGETLVRKLFKK